MDSPATPDRARLHRRGAILIVAAALLWSCAGLFMRAIPVDLWTLLAGRSLAGGLFLLAAVVVRHGRAAAAVFGGIGLAGLAVVPVAALSMVCFVSAMKLTSVAQVMIVYATQPFASAAVAWVWLGEPMGRRTILASLVAMAGVAITLLGAPWGGPVLGAALAFLMVFTFAFVMVLARGRHEISMTAVNSLACLLCAACCLPLAQPALLTPHNAAMLALFGCVTIGLGFILLMEGARHVPAGEASLLSTADVPLSPLWVWLVFGEQPGAAALIGGGVVIGAMLWQIAGGRSHGR